MPAGMEWTDSMMSVREVPWHRHQNALVLEEAPKNWEEAWKAAGLSWKVIQVPVTYEWNGSQVEDPSIRLNIREDTGAVLGRVTADYKIMQNDEAFKFLGNVIGTDMMFETAGSLAGGRTVYVTTRLPEWVEAAGDKIGIYGFLTNSHSGWAKGKAKTTAQRVVCRNTHDAALGDGLPTFAWSHVGDVNQQLLEARELMGIAIDFSKQFKEFGDKLGQVKFTEKKLENVLKDLYPIQDNWTERKQNNAKDHRNSIMFLWREGETCNELANAPHTAWTALQAVTEYVEHGVPTSDDEEKLPKAEAVIRRAFDDPKKLKTKATRMIAESAGVALV